MNNVQIAEDYYTSIGQKKVASVEKYLHSEVQFISPLFRLEGKAPVMEAIEKFAAFFKSLKIRSKFGSGDEVVIVYDLDCPMPVGPFSAAVLMTFEEGKVAKMELFYDARPFEKL